MDSELIGIIPAAGLGTRMGGGSKIGLPKALVKTNGQTLLETAIATLKAIGVSKIIIVVGYLGEAIRDFVSARNFGISDSGLIARLFRSITTKAGRSFSGTSSCARSSTWSTVFTNSTLMFSFFAISWKIRKRPGSFLQQRNVMPIAKSIG